MLHDQTQPLSHQRSRMSQHTQGVILVVISAIVFSSAGIFSKAVESGAWEIIFWRGVFAAGFTTAYILWRGSFRQDFVNMGRSGWAVAVVGASGTAAFISAFKLTTMANVMLIYAAAPLIAALLAYLWIRERMTSRVMIGCAAAFVGVAIIVQGSVGALHLRGDLLALWMTIAMATLMAIYRRYPLTPAAGPAVLMSVVLLPFGVFYGDLFHVPLYDFAVTAAFGLIFAIASVTLAEGMKRIPAGETALLSALETPLAPLFGWLFFMEMPANTTFLGGIIIFVAVLSTQLKSLKE
jgi:drug/metabolite transporter (DMT)-like permease